ncbi:MAG TPA: GNAT family N-acetyltransferase [Chloroflexia bacterium]|nr:GNAT family N-acetyltransferase [Chloroflexia bacterium]
MSNIHLPGLTVREGCAADLPQVKTICADVHDGDDYVPHVWTEWASNPANHLYIFELDGKPAALYCLRLGLAGPGSGWIQGVRVARAYQRQGIAAVLIQHAIERSRTFDLSVLRYTTAADNVPMHRLAESSGFQHAGIFMNYPFVKLDPPPHTPLPARLVVPSEFDGAYNMIINSVEYLTTNGFYCDAWLWKPLSIDALREHIERCEVYSPTGALTALAIMTRSSDGSFWLPYMVGEAQAQRVILASLVKKVLSLTPPQQEINFCAQLPHTLNNEQLLTQFGFAPDSIEPYMWLYELVLDETGVPQINDNPSFVDE